MSTPTQMAYTLEQLNAATTDEAVAMLDGLYEHSPWIARQALASRPFRSLPQLRTRCGACWTRPTPRPAWR